MPWMPELFSAPALERIQRTHRANLAAVPYFAGVLAGDPDALIASFAGVPELHHPTRGRVKGADALKTFVERTAMWLSESRAEVEAVGLIVTPHRTIEEVAVHFDGPSGRIGLPVAVVADREQDARLREIRMYFSTWPLTGSHAVRPPLLQLDPAVNGSDIVGAYQRALAAGDVDAVVGTFEADAVVREPAGGTHVHRGTDALRALYTFFFSNGGGIPLEHCASTDDGQACAIEYNVTRWGVTDLPPEAGIAIYVRGATGKLACARIYDDSDPPLRP
jgi:hypothetical protein